MTISITGTQRDKMGLNDTRIWKKFADDMDYLFNSGGDRSLRCFSNLIEVIDYVESEMRLSLKVDGFDFVITYDLYGDLDTAPIGESTYWMMNHKLKKAAYLNSKAKRDKAAQMGYRHCSEIDAMNFMNFLDYKYDNEP